MNAKKTPNLDAGNKRVWQRWALIVLSLAVLAPFLTIGGMLAFYLKDEVENRRTMAYLNFEQQGYRLRELLRDRSEAFLESVDGHPALRFGIEPSAIFQDTEQGLQLAAGELAKDDFNRLNTFKKWGTELQVIKSNGQLLLSHSILLHRPSFYGATKLGVGAYRAIWRLDPNWFLQELPPGPHLVYLVNRDGELIYTSTAAEAGEAFVKRKLVQDFVRSPLSRAGTALSQEGNRQNFGFYMVIPDSNVTIFVESSAHLLFAPLLRPAAAVLIVLFMIGFLLVFVLRDAFKTLTLDIQFISKALDDFAKGYLIPTQLSPKEFMRELGPLVESINKNTRGVRERVDVMEMGKNR